MLSAVIDTTVFVRGLLKSPHERKIILLLKEARFSLLISEEILGEVLEVVNRPKFKPVFIPEAVNDLLEIIKTQAKIVIPTEKITACRDAKDDKFIECAASAVAANIVIVTSDKDLLVLNPFRHIPIITPKEFLGRLE